MSNLNLARNERRVKFPTREFLAFAKNAYLPNALYILSSSLVPVSLLSSSYLLSSHSPDLSSRLLASRFSLGFSAFGEFSRSQKLLLLIWTSRWKSGKVSFHSPLRAKRTLEKRWRCRRSRTDLNVRRREC